MGVSFTLYVQLPESHPPKDNIVLIEKKSRKKGECELNGWALPFLNPTAADVGVGCD